MMMRQSCPVDDIREWFERNTGVQASYTRNIPLLGCLGRFLMPSMNVYLEEMNAPHGKI